jgi:hypothetical protein
VRNRNEEISKFIFIELYAHQNDLTQINFIVVVVFEHNFAEACCERWPSTSNITRWVQNKMGMHLVEEAGQNTETLFSRSQNKRAIPSAVSGGFSSDTL